MVRTSSTSVAAIYPNHLQPQCCCDCPVKGKQALATRVLGTTLHLVANEMTHSRAHLQPDCASYCSSARRRLGPSLSECYCSAASDFLCHWPQSAATANARWMY